ncbi:MAG: two-component system C4-dicarboxylate transport sensor histidine kinase DctB [Paraglaciecola sp.]
MASGFGAYPHQKIISGDILKSERLFFIIIIFTVISFLLTWKIERYVYDWSMTQLKQQGENRLLDTISEIHFVLDRYQYLPFFISQNRDVQRMLLSPSPTNIATVSRYLEQTNLVAGTTALFVLNAQGQAKAFSHWREQQDLYRQSHQNQPDFRRAIQGKQGLYISMPGEKNNGSFYLSAPIYDQSRFIGVAIARLDLEILRSALPKNENYLFSRQEKLVLASNDKWRELVQYGELEGGDNVELRTLANGHQILMQSVLLDYLDLKVTVISEVDEIKSVARSARYYTLAGCIALTLLLLLFRERHLKNISRQETREVLEHNEAQQRRIINTANVGMVTLNYQGEIQFINPMAMVLFDVSMPRVLGLNISQLITKNSERSSLIPTLKHLGQRTFKPVIAVETTGLRADKSEFPMLFSIKKMAQDPAVLYLVTMIDITPRKRLEKALQQANDQLEYKVVERTHALKEAQDELVQAEKMAALGRMSSAVVHELNQPLTAMRTYISICRHLITQQSEQPQLDDNLKLLNGLTDRMAVMTQQLKTFAYKKPQHLSAVNPANVIDQALLLFHERIEYQGIKLQYDRSEQPIHVAGDNARLEQVFVNLIKNACDAMTVEQQNVASQKLLNITIEHQLHRAETVKISISDSGQGIAEQDIPHLFEPFFTTKTIGDGLGLGLSIVSSIVKDLKGVITVHNKPAGGARFEVILPRYIEELKESNK